MIIAIDFDGTIVEHKFPKIGKVKLFAFETLKQLQKQGHQLILWTYRSGDLLIDAVEFCRSNGIEFYAINKNFPDEVYDENTDSRKILADIYVDDRNVGGFLGWSKIWQIINENSEDNIQSKVREESFTKNTLSNRIKGIFR